MCLNWLNTVPLNGSHTYKEVTRSPISASQSWGSCSSGIPTGTYPTSRATKLLNQRATASLSPSERPKGSTSHSYQPGSIPYLTAVNLSVNNQYRTVLGGVGSGGGGGVGVPLPSLLSSSPKDLTFAVSTFWRGCRALPAPGRSQRVGVYLHFQGNGLSLSKNLICPTLFQNQGIL